MLPAGSSRPFSCLIKFTRISPLKTEVWAVGAFNFRCLVLLGRLLVLVCLTVESRALLAQDPGGVAKRLAMVVAIPLKARFLATLGSLCVGLGVALLVLAPNDVPKWWLSLP